ncbi:MAG: hypothetical protein GY835_15480 [bacterium]|nr:hypothetical protein [bacterium]
MKVRSIRELEDCFDGSFIKEATLDGKIDRDFIKYLGSFGELEYHSDFARPYYRVDRKEMFTLKGVEGNSSLRLILARKRIEEAERFFTSIVEEYLQATK